jgi:hypothetical protein
MSLRKSWLKPDYSDPRQRYIYIDGAPYDGGPDAADPFRRSFRTPTLKATTIAGLFIAAVTALFANPNSRQQMLLAVTAAFPYVYTRVYKQASETRRTEYPSLKNVVIDKTGRAPTGPGALLEVDDYYRREIVGSARVLAVVPTLVVGMWTGLNLAVGASPGHGAEGEVMLTAVGVVPHASQLGWALYARHQIHRSNKPWTVTADPPPLKKEVTEPAQPGHLSALVPVRIRASL